MTAQRTRTLARQDLSTGFLNAASGRARRLSSGLAAALFGLAVSAAAPAATITVNSTSDVLDPGGVCTLRGAIDAVNNSANANGCTASGTYGTNDTIAFAASLSGQTILFASQIVISKNLTLTGHGTASLALDGGGTTRLFYVDGGTALTVTGLTLQKGNAGSSDYGGAIWIDVANHTLTVRDSVFNDNRADFGGAIQADTATVSDSAFTGNTATNSGGAISADTATVSASTFSGNEASVDAGAIDAGTATVSASTFTGNRANNGFGGALWAVDATVSASTFSGNTAINGGAIYAYTAVTVSASTFTGNTASNGGAIYAYTDATVSGSTFSGNTAGADGGAIIAGTADVSASTFFSNTADRGGAIWAVALTGNGLTLVNNTAPDGAAVYISLSGGAGGGGTLNNSLIAGGSSVTTAHCAEEASGLIAGGTNLEWREGVGDEISCGSTAPVSGGAGSLTAIVATTLADNGGPTQTLALPAGSPAIGAADAATATVTDQRGVTRDAAPDLGAYELLAPSPPPAVTAIPALGPLALLALAGLLGGVGVMRRRE